MALTGLLWWIDRWRKSSAYMDMTAAEQGVYRNLLDEAWLRRGVIPNNERVLAKASGDARAWPRVRRAVLAHFRLTPTGWRNETLDRVLQQAQRHRDNQQAYRERRVTGSVTDSVTARVTGSVTGHNPASPDPDPDPDLIQPTRVASVVLSAHTVEPKIDPLQLRAGRLVERYAELFYLHRQGARYHSRLHLDFMKACELVRTWPDDARLEKLAVIVLTTDDEWISRTDRGFGVFASRASWADDRLRAWEIANQVET